MENKKTPFLVSIISIIFALIAITTIGAGLYFLALQKYNPIISIAVLAVGIINLVLGIKIYQGKQWAYYSLILYLISIIFITILSNLDIYLKLIILIIDSGLLIYIFKNSRIKKYYKIDELDSVKDILSDTYKFTKEDSKSSWAIVISLILMDMYLILFPLLTLLTGTSLPIVIVESCSMYHEDSFNNWWERNSGWYEKNDITKSEFSSYPFINGMNKGDIILVQASDYKEGDVIIFKAPTAHPIIHRIVSLDPLETKGDHNLAQIDGIETDITPDRVIGKAIFRIPLLGWIKLIFFEPFQAENNKGLCN